MEQDTPYHTLMSAWHTAVFLQDNYRITPRFTANLGVRWDIDTPPVESSNLTAAFVPGVSNPRVVPIGAAWACFSPAIRAWRAASSPRSFTTLRPVSALPGIPSVTARPPFAPAPAFSTAPPAATSGISQETPSHTPIRQTFNSITSLDATSTGIRRRSPTEIRSRTPTTRRARASLLPASIESIGTNVQWPYIYQFNLAIERQLPGQVSLTTAYVGTLSRDVPTMIDDNYAPYAPGASTSQASINARRPYDPGVLGQNIFLITNQTASYHSLQIAANRPLTHNLMLNGFYVWSHAIQSSNESAIGQMTAQDFANLWEEKGPLDADRRNVATISGMWKIDYYHGSNFFVRNVVNGWTVSPIFAVQSGSPFEITTGSTKNDDSNGHNRPDLVAGVNPFLDPHRTRAQAAAEWFNTAAFVANGHGVAGGIGPGGADGNTPRDFLRGPGSRDVDLGIFRDIRFGEKITLQLRGEATNAFNLVSLNNPSGTSGPPPTVGAKPSSSSFGKITSAASPRIIQVGARLTF